jgi:CRISPR-associated protein Cmr4
MYKQKRILFLTTETSVHPGAGSDVGIVDLPIQREVHTHFPIIRGSSLKGAFRWYYECYSGLAEKDQEKLKLEEIEKELQTDTGKKILYTIFGADPNSKDASRYASAIVFTDARMLFFPVKSLKQVFAYITCPMVLRRFLEDLKKISPTEPAVNEVEKFIENLNPADEEAIVLNDDLIDENTVVLEEYAFPANKIENPLPPLLVSMFSDKDFRRQKVSNHLVVLSDSDFTEFVKHSTEIVPRIKIDKETGTAQGGALWYEENIPTDAVFYSLLLFSDARHQEAKIKKNNKLEPISAGKLLEIFSMQGLFPTILQLGGNETVGRGLIKPTLFPAVTHSQGGEK